MVYFIVVFFWGNQNILSPLFTPKPLVHNPFLAPKPPFTAPFSHAAAAQPCSQPLFRTRPCSQPLLHTRPLHGLVHNPFFARGRGRCAALFTAPFSTRPLRPLFTTPFPPEGLLKNNLRSIGDRFNFNLKLFLSLFSSLVNPQEAIFSKWSEGAVKNFH